MTVKHYSTVELESYRILQSEEQEALLRLGQSNSNSAEGRPHIRRSRVSHIHWSSCRYCTYARPGHTGGFAGPQGVEGALTMSSAIFGKGCTFAVRVTRGRSVVNLTPYHYTTL